MPPIDYNPDTHLYYQDRPAIVRPTAQQTREVEQTKGASVIPCLRRRIAPTGGPPPGASFALDGLTIGSLFKDRVLPGSVPVTAHSDPIGVARDITGNAIHFSAPVADSVRYVYSNTSNIRIHSAGAGTVLTAGQATATAWTIGISWRLKANLASGAAASLLVIRTSPTTLCEVILTNLGGYEALSFCAKIGNTGTSTAVGWGNVGSDVFGTNPQYAVISFDGGATPANPGSYTISYKGVEKTANASGAVAAADPTQVTSLGGRYYPGGPVSVNQLAEYGRVIFYSYQLNLSNRAGVSNWLFPATLASV